MYTGLVPSSIQEELGQEPVTRPVGGGRRGAGAGRIRRGLGDGIGWGRGVLELQEDLGQSVDPEMPERVGGMAPPDQRAPVDDHQIVSKPRILDVVGDAEDGRPLPARQVGELSHDPEVAGGIQAAGGLVDHQKPRAPEELGRQMGLARASVLLIVRVAIAFAKAFGLHERSKRIPKVHRDGERAALAKDRKSTRLNSSHT